SLEIETRMTGRKVFDDRPVPPLGVGCKSSVDLFLTLGLLLILEHLAPESCDAGRVRGIERDPVQIDHSGNDTSVIRPAKALAERRVSGIMSLKPNARETVLSHAALIEVDNSKEDPDLGRRGLRDE